MPCTTSIVVDGKRFENYDDYPASGLGNIPLRTALANSCNTAFISQRGKLGQQSTGRRRRVARHGRRPRPRLPGVLRQRRAARRVETEKAADLIGQGKILASPMVMATVIASIQAGRLVVPSSSTSVTSPPPEGVTGPVPPRPRRCGRCCAGW